MNVGLIFGNIVIQVLIFVVTAVIAGYFIYSIIRVRVRVGETREKIKELTSELARLESRYADEANKLEKEWEQRKASLGRKNK